MALILNIDVSGKQGFVAVSKDGICIDSIINDEPMQHAAFLQPAVQAILNRNELSVNQINAVSLSNGPGSYTGLRVGLASAKGLCYALQIPLITINTLQVLALSASTEAKDSSNYLNKLLEGLAKTDQPLLFCPIIDARRMEVFFGLYDENNKSIIEPNARIIDDNFLHSYLLNHVICFFGSGASKWQAIVNSPNAVFLPEPLQQDALCQLSSQKYEALNFANLIQAEPFYCKAFHETGKKSIQ
jgi:tRNA threonylcarbamoyladenosine biosynthesis protein TsaB